MDNRKLSNEANASHDENKCLFCGEIIEEGALFCPFCGKKQIKEYKHTEEDLLEYVQNEQTNDKKTNAEHTDLAVDQNNIDETHEILENEDDGNSSAKKIILSFSILALLFTAIFFGCKYIDSASNQTIDIPTNLSSSDMIALFSSSNVDVRKVIAFSDSFVKNFDAYVEQIQKTDDEDSYIELDAENNTVRTILEYMHQVERSAKEENKYALAKNINLIEKILYKAENYINVQKENKTLFDNIIIPNFGEDCEIIDKSVKYKRIFYLKTTREYEIEHKILYSYDIETGETKEIIDRNDNNCDYETIEEFIISPNGESIILLVNHGGNYCYRRMLKVNKQTNSILALDEWTRYIDKTDNEFIVYREICINYDTAKDMCDMLYKYRRAHYDFNGNLLEEETDLLDEPQ